MGVYEFGPFQLDAQRLLLLDRGEPVALGPKVVETLLALVEHPGDVLPKAKLLDRIWPEGFVDEANLAQNVYVLRKTLRARLGRDAIETVPRCGYRFTLPVTRREDLPVAQPAVARAVVPRRRFWEVAAAVTLCAGLLGAMSGAGLSPQRLPGAVMLSQDGSRLYEIGRYYWNMRTRDGMVKSLEYFGRVVDSDPGDARGYAALAAANAIMGDYNYGPARPQIYFGRARAYARKALAIDANCGEAYAVLGMLSTESMDVPSAKQLARAVDQLKRAIALDPESGPAHEWYGIALYELGRIDEAYGELRRAAELDPLSVATTAWLGNAAYLEGHYGDAIAYARETLDLSPQRREAYETLGLAYEARGDRARAVDALRRFADGCGKCRPEAAALLAEVFAHTNRMAQARAELEFARAHAKQVEPEDLAVALAAVGDDRVAIAWLRRTKPGYLRAVIADDPRFAALRALPQVAAFEKPA